MQGPGHRRPDRSAPNDDDEEGKGADDSADIGTGRRGHELDLLTPHCMAEWPSLAFDRDQSSEETMEIGQAGGENEGGRGRRRAQRADERDSQAIS